MDYTLSGKLVIMADEDVLEEIQEAFTEGADDEDRDFSELIGEADEDDIEINEESLSIPFEETYEILSGFDYSKSLINFMKRLANQFPDIKTMSFEGRYETWNCDSFMNFLCKYENGELRIFESESYNTFFIDADNSYEEILDELGWDSSIISKSVIDQFKGKEICVLEEVIERDLPIGEDDLLETVPTDYYRKDLTTKINEN